MTTKLLAMLDASLELQLGGVYVCLSLLPESSTYPAVQRAIVQWCAEHKATIQVVTEDHGDMQYVMVGSKNIARVHVPVTDAVVVDVDALRLAGAL